MDTINQHKISISIFKLVLPLLVLLFVQMAANALGSTPPEQKCFEMAQNKVAWNKAGQTSWSPTNLQRLCKGTTNPVATIACFKNIINQFDDFKRGIEECSGPKPNAQTTFYLNGYWAGFNADGSKSTFIWQINQTGSNLSFVDVGAGTGTKFSGQIQGNQITDSNGKTGIVGPYGDQIKWSDGVVWKRQAKPKNPAATPNNPPLADTGSIARTIKIKNK
jgi:hypothetical protein